MMATTSRKLAKTAGPAKEKSVAVSEKPRQKEEKKVSPARAVKSSISAKTGPDVSKKEKPGKPAGQRKSDERMDMPDHAGKGKKPKLLKDSYSISEGERKQIDILKKRCADHGKQIKKSYLVRAGIQALALMDDSELLTAVKRVG